MGLEMSFICGADKLQNSGKLCQLIYLCKTSHET